MLHRLTRLAEVYIIAFVLTNQVQSNPDETFADDPMKVAGGNILAHATTYPGFSFRKKLDTIGLLSNAGLTVS